MTTARHFVTGFAAAVALMAFSGTLLAPKVVHAMRPPVHADATLLLSSVPAAPGFQVTCSVNAVLLNLRSGPGTTFSVVEQMAKGTPFAAIERNADSSWIFGSSPQTSGWTAPRFLDCTGDITQLPMKAAQAGDAAPVPAAPVAPAQPAVPTAPGAFKLIQPLADRLSGRQTFVWEATTPLKPNQGFELVLWEDGQIPLSNGFGLAEPKLQSTAAVDMDKMATILPRLRYDTNYHWGVLLVQLRPYRRLQYLGGEHRFLFAPPASSSTDDSDDARPVPTAPAPPKPPK